MKSGNRILRSVSAILLLPLVLAGLSWNSGCTASRREMARDDHDAIVRIPQMKRQVDQNDYTALPQLVRDLESDDPVIRLYAINALERLTGKRLGYDYAADEPGRREAVARWRQWLTENDALVGSERKRG